MITIHKFEVSQWAVWELPVTALFLSMQVQRGVPVAWFLYDTEHPKVGRPVIVIGTGHEIADVPGVLHRYIPRRRICWSCVPG